MSCERAPAFERTALILLGGLTLVAVLGFHSLRHDDAFITFRYGQNTALGRGVTFNPGEYNLGSTSPGEVLVSALAYALGGREATPSLMSALGCVAWMAQAGALYLLLARHAGTWVAFAVAAGLALGSAGSSSWVALETNQAVALNLGALLFADRRRWSWAALLAALAGLFRPDAYLLSLPLAVLCLRDVGRAAWKPALVFLAVSAPWQLFATFYYGSPLPLTAAAKFQKTGFADYAAHIARHAGGLLLPHVPDPPATLLAWLSGVAGWVVLWRLGPVTALLVLYALAHYAAYLYLRPFTPHTWHLYPAECMLVVGSLTALGTAAARAPERLRPWTRALLAAVLLVGALRTWREAHTHATAYWNGGRNGAYERVARFLRERGDPGSELFAAVEVGTVAYYSDFRALDLGGLVSRPGEKPEQGRVRWLVFDELYEHLAPAGSRPVFEARSGGFVARVYDRGPG